MAPPERFTEAEVFAAVRVLLSDEDAVAFKELCDISSDLGQGDDWTLDTLILLSLHSAEFEQRVMTVMSPTFLGEQGEERRRFWEERRNVLKREVDSQLARRSRS